MLRVPTHDLQTGLIELDEDTSRYVIKVHRKRLGDQVALFDPARGVQGVGEIVSERLPRLKLRVLAVSESPRHEMPVTVAVCLAKGDKPEQAMRDATQFGARALVLVQSERSVPKGEQTSRRDRLLRVSEQVARQCERGHLPDLAGPMSLSELLAVSPARQLRLVAAWHPTERPLLAFAPAITGPDPASEVLLVVGPEGGLSSGELELCLAHSCCPVSLGPYVLRAEVAVGAGLAVLRALFDHQHTP
jgi:16S rRNA (uracil1498-N3)-methyltransferase